MKRLAGIGRALRRAAFVVSWLWTIGAAWFSELGPAPVPQGLAVAILVGFPLAWFRTRNRSRVGWIFAGFVLVVIVAWQFKRPGTDRDWTPDMKRAPTISVEGDRVTIQGIRDCRYRTSDDFDVRYYDRTLDLSKLRSIDFMVERFHALHGLAHTLLSFGFEDGEYLAISVEIRREAGEGFGPIAGLYKQFELMYVIGSEQDLIGLRTNHRASEVWLYPIKTTLDRRRAMLVAMLERAKALQDEPEFYNTLTSSCTTNIVDHVVELASEEMDFDWRVWLPGYSDELAYELGLIDTQGSFEDAAKRFRIDKIALQGPIDADFSRRIRSGR